MIYGSLVPLQFRPISMPEAWSVFRNLTLRPLDEVSRIDWSTNIILGMPASFLGLSVFYRIHKISALLFLTCIVFIVCLLTSVSAEYLQIFFSSRVPSLNDIAAQALGEVAGIVLYFIFGKQIIRGLHIFVESSLNFSKLQCLFIGYLILIILYNVLPLDLTLNPADIHHKWKTGHIILTPFGFEYQSLAKLFYNTIADILIWVPGAFFLVRYQRFSILLSVLFLCSIAICIEGVQLFIMSRFTDVTDIIKTLLGAGLGGFAGRIGLQSHIKEKRIPAWVFSARMLVGLLALGAWAICICLLYWFPYDFSFDKYAIKQSLQNMSLIPFSHYQSSSIFTAFTQLFRNVIYFAPSGVVISYMLKGGRLYSEMMTILLTIFLFLIIFLVAAGVELGQFFLPGRVPDLTDVMLKMLGAWLGYIISKQLYKPKQRAS